MSRAVGLAVLAWIGGLWTAGEAVGQTTYTWNTAATGTLAWATPADWTGGASYPGSTTGIFDTAIFSSSFNPTAAVNLTVTTIYLNTIDFNQTTTAFGYTITGGTINLGGTTPTINVSTAGVTEVIKSVLAGTSLTKMGAGALTLSGTNTFTGGATIAAGQLNINSNAALGTGTFTVDAGTTIDNTSGSLVTLGTNAQTWSGNFTFGGSNSLNLGTGPVTLGSSVTLTVTGAGSLTLGGTITGVSNNLTVASALGAGAGPVNFNGAVSFSSSSTVTVNGGNLVVGSAGSLTTGFLTVGINGGATASGLTLNGGTITVNGSSSGANPTAVFTVGGQTFNGAPAALSAFTVNSGILNITVSSKSSVGAAIGQANGSSSVLAVFSQTGGAVNYSPGTNAPYFSIANGTGAAAMTVSGGTFSLSANAEYLVVGTRGNGTLTVSGAGLVSDGSGNVSLGFGNQTTPQGVVSVVNLGDGVSFSGGTGIFTGGTSGTLITQSIGQDTAGQAFAPGTSAILNFNGGTLRAGGPGTAFIPASSGFNVAVLAGGGIVDNNGFAITVSQAITSGVSPGNDGGVLFKGAGVVSLTGANSYTGPTLIQAGIVNYQNAAALGTTSAITVAAGATAQIEGGIAGGAQRLTISGAGAAGAAGALESVTGANSYSGPITLGANATISVDNGSTLALNSSAAVNGGGFNLALGGAGAGAISSVLNPTTAGVTKTGTGTWVMSASNTYTGPTNINAGTLGLIGGTTQASPFTVGNGGILSIANPGPTTSTATLAGNLTFGAAAADVTTLNLFAAADWTTSSHVPLSVNGALTANGGTASTTINIATPAAIVVGTYNLIGHAGSLGGTGLGAFVLGTLSTPRTTANLLDTGSAIQLNVTEVDHPKWTGAVNGVWDIGTTMNWQLAQAGTATAYIENDTVVFDDSATGTNSISLNVAVAPNSVTFGNTTKAYSLSGAGSIGGSGALAVSGGGIVSLATSNGYSGGTIVANNSQLNINNPSAIGTGPLTIAAGSTVDNTSGAAVTLVTNNVQSWGGSFGFGGSNPLNLGSGAVTLGQSLTVTVNGAGALTVGGPIGDGLNGYALTAAGAGTLVLTGTNTYSGGTTIQGATLQIGNGGSTGSIVGNIVDNGNLVFNLSRTLTIGTPITGNGGFAQAGSGTLTLTGSNTYAGTTSINAGVLNVGAVESPGTSGPFGVGGPIYFGGGILQFSPVNSFDYSSRFSSLAGQAFNIDTNGQTVAFAGSIASAGGSFTKLGAGTLTLSGNNSYTAQTTLAAGQLNINSGGSGATNSAIGTGLFVIDAGTTIDNTSGAGIALATNNSMIWNGVFTFGGSNALNFGTGPVTMGANVSIMLNGAGPLTVGGAIGDSGRGFNLVVTSPAGGSLTLDGASTYSGATAVRSGTLIIGPTGAIATTSLTVGINGGTVPAFLTLNGGSISANTLFSAGGTSPAGATTALDTVTITGGTFTVTGSQFIVGNATLNGTPGTLVAQFIQTGGTVNFSPAAPSANFTLANGTGAVAMILSGGTYNGSANSTSVNLGAQGNATLTVSGAGVFNEPFGAISLGYSAAVTPATVVSTLNLGDGASFSGGGSIFTGTSGVVVAKNVGKDLQGTPGGNTAILNFNGGTLRAGAPTAQGSSFIAVDLARVLAGGGIIDNAGFPVTIAQPLLSGAFTDGGLLFMSSSGAGATTLTGTSSYNGGTTVWSGTLAAGAGGPVFGTGAVTVNPSPGTTATLSTGTGAREVTINGLNLGGQSATSAALVSGTTAFDLGTSGAITFIGLNNPQGAVISAPLDLDGTACYITSGLTMSTSVGLTISGQIMDSVGGAALVTVGPGAVSLTNSGNSYSGSTFVLSGTLIVNNGGGSATGMGNVAVSGTLAGIGRIVPATGNGVTVSNGGIIRGGVADGVNNWGTLTISSNLTMNAGSTITAEVIRAAANQVNAGLVNLSNSMTAILNLGTAAAALGSPGYSVNINVVDTAATLVVGETYTINLVQAYQASPSSPTTTNFHLNGAAINAGTTIESSLVPGRLILAPPGGTYYFGVATQNNAFFAANMGWSVGVSPNGELLELTLIPEYHWIGAISALWTAGANWSSGLVPAGGMIASFNQPSSPHTTVSLNNATQPIGAVSFDSAAAAYVIGSGAVDALLFDANGTVAVTGAVANLETINAAIKTQGALNIINDGTGGLTFNGALTLGSGTAGLLTFSGSGTTMDYGSISTGVSGLTQAGPGIVVLGGSSSYTGTTSVLGGTLIVNNTSGSATGSSNVLVSGLLAGTGTIVPGAGAGVTINSGGTIRGGTANGVSNWSTLNVAGNLTMTANSAILTEVIRTGVNQVNAGLIDLSSSPTAVFALGTALAHVGGTGNLVNINVLDTYGTLQVGETYTINLVKAYQANPSSPTATNFQLNGASIAAGTTIDSTLLSAGVPGTINYSTQRNSTFAGNSAWSLGVSGNGEFLQLTLIPEFHWVGSVSALWAAAGNWSANIVPVSGMIALFNQPASANTSVNLGGVAQPIDAVVFDSAAAAYTLGSAMGDALLFDANGTILVTAAVANVETIGAGIQAQGPLNIVNNGTGGLSINGALTLGAGTAGLLTFSGSGTTTYGGNISTGASALTLSGTGMLILTGSNTYSGTTTIVSGTLVANNTSGSATGTGNVIVDGILAGIGSVVPGTGNSVTVNSGGTIRGGVADGMNNNGTLSVGNNLTLFAGATITTEASRMAAGTATASLIDLSGSQTAIVSLGTAAAHLGGANLININVLDTNTTLMVGETYALDLIKAYQANPMAPTTTNFQLNGTTVAAGTVIDSGYSFTSHFHAPITTLTVSNNAALAASNDGWSLAIDPTGQYLQLTITPGNTWTGALSALWTNVGNWSANVVPISGNYALFSQATSPNTTVSLGGAAQPIGAIVFNSGPAAYTLGAGAGDAFLFDANGSVVVTGAVANPQIFNAAIQTQGAFTINNSGGGGLTLNGNLSLGGSSAGLLTFLGSGTTTFNGNITTGANGLLQAGPGTVILNGTNSFTGGTTITGGTLRINSDSALGAANGTVNLTGGTLQFVAVGGITLNSSRTIVLGGGAFDTNNGNDSINGVVAGADPVNSNLIKNGAGALTLNSINTYAGSTNVNAGSLIVSSTGSISGGALNVNNANSVLPGTSVNLLVYNTAQTVGPLSGAVAQPINGNTVSIFLSPATTLTVNQTAATTFQGSIFGGGNLVLGANSNGTLQLSNNNIYTGGTTINGGTLQSNIAEALPNSTALVFSTSITAGGTAATLNLNNHDQTIASLAGGSLTAGFIQTGLGAGGAILTIVNSTAPTTYGGIISGSGGLTLGLNNTQGTNNTQPLTLTGPNSFTGPVTINSGTLRAGANWVLNGGKALPVQPPFGPLPTPYPGTVTLASLAGATLDLNNFDVAIGSLQGGGPAGGNITLGNGTGAPGSGGTLQIIQSQVTIYAGVISGNGNLIVGSSAGGQLILAGHNTYSGATYADVIVIAENNALPTNNNVIFGSDPNDGLDLNGYDQQVSTILGGAATNDNGTGTIVDSSSGHSVLTLAYNPGNPPPSGSPTAFTGVIANDVNVVIDAGIVGATQTVEFSGPNNTTGSLTVGARNNATSSGVANALTIDTAASVFSSLTIGNAFASNLRNSVTVASSGSLTLSLGAMIGDSAAGGTGSNTLNVNGQMTVSGAISIGNAVAGGTSANAVVIGSGGTLNAGLIVGGSTNPYGVNTVSIASGGTLLLSSPATVGDDSHEVGTGSLIVNGSLGTAASPIGPGGLTIESGGVLGGTGTVTAMGLGNPILVTMGLVRGGADGTGYNPLGTLTIAPVSTTNASRVNLLTIRGSGLQGLNQTGGILTEVQRTGANTVSASQISILGTNKGVNLNTGGAGGGIEINLVLSDPTGSMVAGESYTVNVIQVATVGAIRVAGTNQPAGTVIDFSNTAAAQSSGTPVEGAGSGQNTNVDLYITGNNNYSNSVASWSLAVDPTGKILQLSLVSSAVPEPGHLPLMCAGALLAGLAIRRRWSRRGRLLECQGE